MKNRIKYFFNEKIWEIDPGRHSKTGQFFLRTLKVLVIIVRDFFRDKCHTLASSLTYFTLLAIVPFAALVFAVLKYFDVQNIYGPDMLNSIIFEPGLTAEIISYVNRTDLSALGIIGAVALLKITLMLLANIEKAFNDIWGVKERRPFYKKILYYLVAIIILPVIVTVGLSAAMDLAGRYLPLTNTFFPYLVTIISFSFFYLVFPAVKVKFKAAFAGGLVAGLLWHAAYRFYVVWAQAAAAELDLIYGGFSQIVLVFLWIYISWIIIFIGTETSFAVQNYRIYKRDDRPEEISFSLKAKAAFMVASLIYKNRETGGELLSAEDIVNISGGPVKIINRILYELTEVGILNETHKGKTRFFEPAKETGEVTPWYIENELKNSGKNKVAFSSDSLYEQSEELYRKMDDYLKEKYDKEPVSKL